MNCQGESMVLLDIFRSIYRQWKTYVLEAACDSALNEWELEKPEYVGRVRNWVETDSIPDDHDLQALCRVYQERERKRLKPC